MKRILPLLLVLISLNLYANTDTSTDTTITKEVIGTNQQQLDIKEIDTEELLLQNQNLELTSIDITGEYFKESLDKIKVQQTTTITLEEELSQGVEKKSFFGWLGDLFK